MFHFRHFRVAAIAALCFSITITLIAGLRQVQATEIPPGDSVAFIQTSGPNAPLTNGDFYTSSEADNGPHVIDIDVPCTWPAGETITVALYDPESFNSGPLDPPAIDQIRSGEDNTRYLLKDATGAILKTMDFTPTGGSDGLWVELATFIPDVGGQLCQDDVSLMYTIETTTSDNDEQSWRLSVNHDPDCSVSTGTTTGSCSGISPAMSAMLTSGNETDDFDGIPGTGDELAIGLLQVSYEHAARECQDFYFFVERGDNPDSRNVTLHNFDMDRGSGDSITYYTPSGQVLNGTVSGNRVWNNGVAGNPPGRVGDTYTIGAADLGWWRAEVCTGVQNQYIFEGETSEPVRFTPVATPRMVVAKDDGKTVTQPNDLLTYTIAFTNTSDQTPSPGAATKVMLTDTLPDNATYQSCAFGTGYTGNCDVNPANAGEVIFTLDGVVAAGDSGSVQITVQVNPDAVDRVVNEVRLDYADILGKQFRPEFDDDVNTIVPVQTIQVEATKVVETINSDAPDGCNALTGETLRYTVIVSNTGNTTATGVQFTDTPDRNTTLTIGSVTTDQGSVTSGNAAGDTSVGVNIGALEPDASVTITFDVTINAAIPTTQTELVNQGEITGTNFAPVLTDDPTTVEADDPTITTACRREPPPQPELNATKVVETLNSSATDTCQALTGETLRYTVIVSNTGNADATNLVFNDTLDANTTLVVGSVTTDQGSVSRGNTAGDTTIGVNIGTVGSNARVTITYDALVNGTLPQPQTELVNQGQVIGDNVGTLLTDDPTTTAQRDPTTTLACNTPVPAPPLLVAAKTVESLNSSATDECKVLVREALLYEVIISNNDPTPATNVTYRDILDANTQLVDGTLQISQGNVAASISGGNTEIRATIGQINPNTSVTISYQARVNDTLPDGPTDIVNQGTVFWDVNNRAVTDDPTQPGNTDPTRTRACPGLTAIELESFTATRQGDTMRVRWVTSAEFDTWGFHLYRSSDGRRTTAERVTPALIPAKGRGQGGATYVWIDQAVEPGVQYTYWLQETELGGNLIEYGPATSIAAQNLNRQIYLPLVRR